VIPTWRKSSRSVNGPNCVEVRNTLDTVRDSKNTAGPTLHGDIRRLTQEIKKGRLSR
jgi:uncharacterized protein DUF397